MAKVIIESERLILRYWRDSDRVPFAQLNADLDVMKYLGNALSRQESNAAVDRQIALIGKGEPAFWALERKRDALFMGCIGVKYVDFETSFSPCYEIGWRLAKDYWGYGYATEGAKMALQIGFARWNIPAIYAFTVPANIKSQHVMHKIGMERVMDGDFEHPKLAKDDPLSKHVLYKMDRADG